MQEEKRVEGKTFTEFWTSKETQAHVYNLAKYVGTKTNEHLPREDITQEIALQAVKLWRSDKVSGDTQTLRFVMGCLKKIALNLTRWKSMGFMFCVNRGSEGDSKGDSKGGEKGAKVGSKQKFDLVSPHKRNAGTYISYNDSDSREVARDILRAAMKKIESFPAPRTKTEANRQRIIKTVFDPPAEFFDFIENHGGKYKRSARMEYCSAKELEDYLGTTWATIQSTLNSFKVELGLHK